MLFAVGSSEYGCSSVYHGPNGGSERETQAIMDFVKARNDHIKAYITVHSYGQKVTTRWGYTDEEIPQDHKELVSNWAVGRFKRLSHNYVWYVVYYTDDI